MRFKDRVAVVTGGGQGIGRAVTERLAGGGAAVVVFDRDAEAAERVAAGVVAAGGRAESHAGSVTEEGDCAAAVALATGRFGALDILVNNAAFTVRDSLATTSPADWDEEFAVTLRGAFLCARAALPALTAQRRGAIVNIGSVNGLLYVGNPAYSAAKAGLVSLTQSLAVEYGPAGVRTNMVSPGSVQTEHITWRMRQAKDPAIFERLARWYPVGRVGRPADIAAAVCFLASDEAGFVNGANLVVDGGLTAGLGVLAAELRAE